MRPIWKALGPQKPFCFVFSGWLAKEGRTKPASRRGAKQAASTTAAAAPHNPWGQVCHRGASSPHTAAIDPSVPIDRPARPPPPPPPPVRRCCIAVVGRPESEEPSA
ncbi:hypothetical protein ABZP36_022334 [Zizania latifolia]